MKKSMFVPFALATAALALTACTAAQKRDLKTMSSDWAAGWIAL